MAIIRHDVCDSRADGTIGILSLNNYYSSRQYWWWLCVRFTVNASCSNKQVEGCRNAGEFRHRPTTFNECLLPIDSVWMCRIIIIYSNAAGRYNSLQKKKNQDWPKNNHATTSPTGSQNHNAPMSHELNCRRNRTPRHYKDEATDGAPVNSTCLAIITMTWTLMNIGLHRAVSLTSPLL